MRAFKYASLATLFGIVSVQGLTYPQTTPRLPLASWDGDRAEACRVLKAKDDASTYKVNIGEFSFQDIFKLSLWNLAKDFKSGGKAPLEPANEWKREIMDVIAGIFTKFCGNHYVRHGFVNVTKQLGLIYQNSVPHFGAGKDEAKNWTKLLENLKTCLNDTALKQLNYTSYGFIIQNLNITLNKTLMIEVKSPEEIVDSVYLHMDLVLEATWWMFQSAFAHCYNTPKLGKPNWAARFKHLFYHNFIHQLRDKWKRSLTPLDFGSVVGDFDIEINMYNMRQCASAAFIYHELTDRHIVRPLTVNSTDLPTERIQNEVIQGEFYTADDFLAAYLIQ